MASKVVTVDGAYSKRAAALSWQRRCLLGGCGAVMPLMVNLLTVDHIALAQNVTLAVMVGYLIRAGVLFGVGALFVSLHCDEKNLLKLFQLGMAAPALILAGVNGYNAAGSSRTSELHVSLFLVPALYAAESQEPVKKFGPPPESTGQAIVRGLLGRPSDRIHFVIAGRYQDLAMARREAQRINTTPGGLRAEVYEDEELARSGGRYAVVIGAYLTEAQAVEVRDRAAAMGVVRDVIVHRHVPGEVR